ncbi:hypothetical protein J8I87_23850, partial [Paraburkholderia sp. LEh10]|uniref:hypothetical protein n=1 Tax=Paraburkholderia sp. LEh10 TaxID=2821353 RepID=UPI001AE7977A
CRYRWHPVFCRYRWHPVFCRYRWHPVFCRYRWHPRLRLAAQALPLCGAALTFFAAAKKVSKESRSHRQPLTVTHGL